MEIGMNPLTKKTLLISLVIALGQVSADANFLDLKKQEQPSIDSTPVPNSNPSPQSIQSDTSRNMEIADKSISLRFENLS